MRKINLNNPVAGGTMAFPKLLSELVENSGTEPYKVAQIRLACRILDQLAAAKNNELLLEDEDYSFVVDRVEAAQFLRATPEILAFINAIFNASVVEVTEKG